MSEPGTLVAGRYRLESVIATGGMGVVWKGWDERLERAVAVKQLRPAVGVPEAEAEVAKDRAMREARITGRLQHPNAVAVLDAVEHDGQPCLVMPFLESTTLSATLRDDPPPTLERVLRIAAEVASALAAAHRLGIVHRDVKPGNILLTGDGAAHLSDFGISHALGDVTLTGTGWIHGTPAYLAPEVARGEAATFASDVFSLGATLYAALEGGPPFGTDPNAIALLHKVAAGQIPAPSRAGPLTGFLLQMLDTDPQARPDMDMVASVLADHTTYAGAVPVDAAAGTMTGAAVAGTGTGTTGTTDHQNGPPTAPTSGATTSGATTSGAATQETSTGLSSWFPRDKEDRDGRRPRRPVLLAGAAVLVLLVVLGAGALLGDRVGGSAQEAGQAPAPTAAADASEDAVGSPRVLPTPAGEAAPPLAPTTDPGRSEETEAEPSAEEEQQEPAPEAEPEPAPAPQPEPEPEPAPEPAPADAPEPTDRATALESAITGYYAMMPGGRAQAWDRMTADYQTNHAGGFEAYDRFWSAISDVAVSDVEATPPDRVVATLTYTFTDGRVDVERTAYRLVDDGGTLKIAASEVLSSRSG
ncbi:serine/threonine-protein kinase [Ornithinimicrobium pekingense]|uniref:non-specific serine/threonine protein kinase n=1 Tax=Ornithinimicrobium pekingense TaxID=384677 RepID=A0ABQ2FCE2_9MICO|nr:serine/threonine-protein kinase [Ornithinimicrobium pekingense]GGK79761.1 hypothetical protein GCM10011509_30370 [Ornithinimicrobium pekingense]